MLVTLAGCQSLPNPGAEPAPGIKEGNPATFAVENLFTIEIPEGANRVNLWLPTPSPTDKMQNVRDFGVASTVGHKFVYDKHGNRYLYLSLGQPEPGEVEIKTTFTLQRYEVSSDLDPNKTRPHTAEEIELLNRYLEDSEHSVIDANVNKLARNTVGSEDNPIRASQIIFKAVLEHANHHAKDPLPDQLKRMKPTGVGSSSDCYTARTGDSADLHSLYSAISRSVGIPTRIVYGALFKGPLNGEEIDQGSHTWVEFHAPNIGWVPVDVAVADMFEPEFEVNEHSQPRADLAVPDGYTAPDQGRVEYYFGNLEARRVSWHWGGDLKLPRQRGEMLDWNTTGYAEVDGRPAPEIVTRKLTYREVN